LKNKRYFLYFPVKIVLFSQFSFVEFVLPQISFRLVAFHKKAKIKEARFAL